MNVFNDEYFMKRALDEAYAAYEKDEVPLSSDCSQRKDHNKRT